MKAKSFLLLAGCIVGTSIVVCLYGDPKPTLNGIVSETHRQLNNLKRLKVVPEHEPQELERYLVHLGLAVGKSSTAAGPQHGSSSPLVPSTAPVTPWPPAGSSLPVVGTALTGEQLSRLPGFLEACQTHFADHPVAIYALDFSAAQVMTAHNLCNSSNCTLRQLDFSFYPSHISNLKIYAYRPIVIQELLRQSGAVLWIDPEYQLSGSPERVLDKVRREGLGAPQAPGHQPTSALTHLGMFEYLHASREAFFFQRMINPTVLLVFDSPQVRYNLMLPWVRCALVPECIAPVGAQSTGCRFDKKPLYRYSGCHRYDASALNVILGMHYGNNKQPYIFSEQDHFFRKVPDGTDLASPSASPVSPNGNNTGHVVR
uniref:Putative conserved secreted protein n=1 Tax=Ornithodoros turicata TaxID=34597 RepID=A0A2R5LM73_9ACAR